MFFMKEKTLVQKKKYFEKFQYFMKISGKKFLTDTLAKMSQNISAYFSISEHFASLSLFQKKTHIYFGYGQGVCPPVNGLSRNL